MIEVLSARTSWCAADERILWCHAIGQVAGKAKYVLYHVSGLDERGDKRWAAGKVLGGVASGAAGFALEVISPSEDSGYHTPSVPLTIVSGQKSDCLAAARLATWQASGANTTSDRTFVWILTSHRLGLLEFTEAKQRRDPEGGSLFSGVKRRVTEVAGLKTPGDETDPRNSPELPRLTVHAEFPNSLIADINVVRDKVKGQKCALLRIALADGSKIDISDRRSRECSTDAVDRLLDMTNGREQEPV